LIDILVLILFNDSLGNNKHEPPVKVAKQSYCRASSFKEHNQDCVHMSNKGLFGLLKELQKLDSLDIENIYKIYEQMSSKGSLKEKLFSDFSSTTWNDVLKSIQNFDKKADVELIEMCKYLVSGTIKDLTVIITFSNNPLYDQYSDLKFVQYNDIKYYYQIKIVDIDPKYVHNIPFYYQLDKEILTNFIESS